MTPLYTITFYKFTKIKHPHELKAQLQDICKKCGVLGTILIAEEGVNGTIAGSRVQVDDFISDANQILDSLMYNEMVCEFIPFSKLKVKVKSEIIRFEVKDLGNESGKAVSAKEWEELIDNGAFIIDTRNDYEYPFGTFINSCNPKTRTFTELPQWLDENLKHLDKDHPIGMFCTGGVRCEKSTAYLKKKGFKNVYQLKGGILKYLTDSSNKDKYWKGWCFVFDDRIAIDSNLNALNATKRNTPICS